MLAASATLGVVDLASSYRHLDWVAPRSHAMKVSAHGLWLALMLDPGSQVFVPAPGVRLSRIPTAYAIGTGGVSTLDDPFPGVRRARDRRTSAVQWIAITVPLGFVWGAGAGVSVIVLCLVRRHGQSMCRACGYPRTGLPANVECCPECGAPFPPEPAPVTRSEDRP